MIVYQLYNYCTKFPGPTLAVLLHMSQKNFSVETILANLRIDELNDMQKAALEAVDANDNLILLSPTGSGKTLAFLLPIVNGLDRTNKKNRSTHYCSIKRIGLANRIGVQSNGYRPESHNLLWWA